MTSLIESSVKSILDKEYRGYMSELFAPKIEKYLSITFNKLNEISAIATANHEEEIAKEQVKYAEFNKHIIDKNRGLMEKLVEVIKHSVTVFDEKKHEMATNYEAKLNLLNDLIVQAEEMARKFESKAKEEGDSSFEKKIYSLV